MKSTDLKISGGGRQLNHLELKAGQRPVDHRLGQLDAAQEGGQVVGQSL